MVQMYSTKYCSCVTSIKISNIYIFSINKLLIRNSISMYRIIDQNKFLIETIKNAKI